MPRFDDTVARKWLSTVHRDMPAGLFVTKRAFRMPIGVADGAGFKRQTTRVFINIDGRRSRE